MQNPILDQIADEEIKKLGKTLPQFRAGDTVKIFYQIPEGKGKMRIQPFQGVVIKKKCGKLDGTFTVRKMSGGTGVERTFPLHSQYIDKVEIISLGKVRRSRLYYLRKLRGKAARIQTRYVAPAKSK